MSSIVLQKSHENAGIHLQKQGVDPRNLPAMRVGVCLDTSGSMREEYRDGHVQDALTHLLALGMHINQEGEVDVFTFDNEAAQCRYPITERNYPDYVRAHILEDRSISKWGGTHYSKPIHLVYRHYFPTLSHLHNPESAKSHLHGLAHHRGHGGTGLLGRIFGHHDVAADIPPVPQTIHPEDHAPTLMIFLTDGEAMDEHAAEVAIRAGAGLPLFWVFVGLAHDSRFLREIAQESDAEFVLLEDGIRISDDRLYASLITSKLGNWLSRMQKE